MKARGTPKLQPSMISNRETSHWRDLLSRAVTTAETLAAHFPIDEHAVQRVVSRFPMRINPYYMKLIRHQGDPIYRQCVPDPAEVEDGRGLADPLHEEEMSPVPGLTHRYPNRVLFLISRECAVYCRFCNRKRKVGRASMVTSESIDQCLGYIRDHGKIRDVLLSGGDPLLLEDEELGRILIRLRRIRHVEVIRIGTRVPCTLPHRVTPRLADMLKQFHPLYVNTHFNHPSEVTPEASLACARLADAGIPMGCQTVLLKGVNDNAGVIGELMQKLLAARVRPYYLFQGDLALGTAHFWTPLKHGLDIMEQLQGRASGLCVPHFAIDLPGGGGKVRLMPESIVGEDKGDLLVKNYQGRIYRFPAVV